MKKLKIFYLAWILDIWSLKRTDSIWFGPSIDVPYGHHYVVCIELEYH